MTELQKRIRQAADDNAAERGQYLINTAIINILAEISERLDVLDIQTGIAERE